MNEIQIIQKQLATERAHFDEVARVCAAHLRAGSRGADNPDAVSRGAGAPRAADRHDASGPGAVDSRGVGGPQTDSRGANDPGADSLTADARGPSANGPDADGPRSDIRGANDSGADGKFAAACADYFAFAVTRFDAPKAQQLATQLAGGPRREFLQAFTEASRTHFERLDALLTGNLPVTEWRAVSRIDADSIFAERTRYSRVKATIPP
jgi:hypothetical protein